MKYESVIDWYYINPDVSVAHQISVKKSELNLQDLALNLDDLTLLSSESLFDF